MNEQNNYTVYVHVNKINGKIYGGITGRKPEIRWQNGTAYKRNPHFNKAIKKYGWNNFEHEIIANNITQQEAKNFEKILISKLNTMNNKMGYNMTLGGEGTLGFRFSEQVKQKMSSDRKGTNSPTYGRCGNKHPLFGKKGKLSATYGRKLTDEQKKHLSISHKGKILSEEHKLHLKQSAKRGENSAVAKSINQYDLNMNFIKKFNTVTEAADELKLDKSNLCKACCGKYKTVGGYIWEYAY